MQSFTYLTKASKVTCKFVSDKKTNGIDLCMFVDDKFMFAIPIEYLWDELKEVLITWINDAKAALDLGHPLIRRGIEAQIAQHSGFSKLHLELLKSMQNLKR